MEFVPLSTDCITRSAESFAHISFVMYLNVSQHSQSLKLYGFHWISYHSSPPFTSPLILRLILRSASHLYSVNPHALITYVSNFYFLSPSNYVDTIYLNSLKRCDVIILCTYRSLPLPFSLISSRFDSLANPIPTFQN